MNQIVKRAESRVGDLYEYFINNSCSFSSRKAVIEDLVKFSGCTEKEADTFFSVFGRVYNEELAKSYWGEKSE